MITTSRIDIKENAPIRIDHGILFGRDIKTIGKHINNALKEVLKDISVVSKYATTASDGKVYQVEYYNIEMVTSVGYKIKRVFLPPCWIYNDLGLGSKPTIKFMSLINL